MSKPTYHRGVRRVDHATDAPLRWGETLAFLCDDREEYAAEIRILFGENGDWYVQTWRPGEVPTGVRLSTSGGASSAVPGLTTGIAAAYRALWVAVGGSEDSESGGSRP